jgi:prefoldin subunit 5
MGEKDIEKRIGQLEKRVNELGERLAKLERTAKKAAKAPKETATDKIAELGRAVRSNKPKSADT